MSVSEARSRYFRENGFGEDGGYSAEWVELELGPLPVRFPNTPARVRAVARHDLHHVATGYGTDLMGEAEISSWEIGAGCGSFVAAWALNLWAMTIGVFVLSPRRMLRAFTRGRRCRTLYFEAGDEIDPCLLANSVSALQQRLGLDQPLATAGTADVAWFAAWSVAGLGFTLTTAAILLSPLLGAIALCWTLLG